jgi:hypothetical protein
MPGMVLKNVFMFAQTAKWRQDKTAKWRQCPVRDADELKMFARDNEDVKPMCHLCRVAPALCAAWPPNCRIAEARVLPNPLIARRVRAIRRDSTNAGGNGFLCPSPVDGTERGRRRAKEREPCCALDGTYSRTRCTLSSARGHAQYVLVWHTVALYALIARAEPA